ncbi:MAG: heavy metal-binding domain-containing protein [Sphingobacteriales bacterium]|nr:MAG: heavy metal-binding domain-containing protein [Sphingobacteriales bacterium]
MKKIIITNTNTIEGKPIIKYFDPISANVVIGTNIFSDISAGFSDFFGGRASSYEKKLEKIYEQVKVKLREKALGSAANKHDASFTDGAGIGACGDGRAVPDPVIEEVARRTPGFSGWQQEQWFTHCGDAAVFLGAAGYEELQQLGKNAIEAIQ